MGSEAVRVRWHSISLSPAASFSSTQNTPTSLKCVSTRRGSPPGCLVPFLQRARKRKGYCTTHDAASPVLLNLYLWSAPLSLFFFPLSSLLSTRKAQFWSSHVHDLGFIQPASHLVSQRYTDVMLPGIFVSVYPVLQLVLGVLRACICFQLGVLTQQEVLSLLGAC